MKRISKFGVLLFGVALIALIALAVAPSTMADTGKTLSECQKLYNEGQFGEAIEKLTALAQDQDLKGEEAKKAYLLLAKAAAGKDFVDQAQLYLKKILDIDCGFELNLKKEPPQLRKIWFEAEKGRDSLCKPKERPDPGLKTVAVLYFENTSIKDHDKMDPLSKGLSAMLVTDLARISKLKVVERERIQYILDEIKTEQSDYFDEKTAVRVGKLLGAHVLLMGSYMNSDDGFRIDARLIKTETGELLKADMVEGKVKDLAKLEGDLAMKIAGDLDLSVKENEAEQIRADNSMPMEAVLAYTRGLNLEDEQQYADAYKAYQEALALNPKMDAAQDRVEALHPMVVAMK
jgi:TolB-like protein